MKKEDFQMFLIDLIMINDEKVLSDKITALYNICYMHGGEALEEKIFGRIYGLIDDAESLVREFYIDAHIHHGMVPDYNVVNDDDDGSGIYGRLVGKNKLLIFGDKADLVTKEITLNLLHRVRKKLREPLKHLRREKLEIDLYSGFENVSLDNDVIDTHQQIRDTDINNIVQKKKNEISTFSDLFYDPLDEIRCVDALRNIRPDKPLIGSVSDVWQKRKGGKGILSAWICRMEDCRIIRTIRPEKELIPLLNDRFPGLNLGASGRTLSGPDHAIVAEFSSITLRKLR